MATTVYGEITATQLSSGGGGGGSGGGVLVGPFTTTNSSSTNPGYGPTNYGYVAINAGSLLGASIMVSSGTTGTGSVAIYKNGTSLVQAFSNISFNTGIKVYSVSYTAGTYTFVANDYLTYFVTANSTAFAFSASIALSTF